MNARSTWIAFFLGLSTGAIALLLYAPASGEDTRKRIGKGIDDTIDQAEDSLEEAAAYLRQQADALTKQAKSSGKTALKQVDAAVNTAADAVAGATKRVQSLV